MLTIEWDDDFYSWKEDEYTDYDFIGDWFVVLKDKKWVGFYRVDDLTMAEVRNDD